MLNQMATAFSGSRVVHSVQIFGNATWHAGSLEDSGTATLTASTDGSSQMQLLLDASGQRTETQIGSGSTAICQWSGADGVVHTANSANCWKPAVWFLPVLSLQPSLLPSNLEITDLGAGTVGSGETIYRHLRSQFVLTDLSVSTTANLTQQSTIDVGVNPTSLLPAVFAYSVRPDKGAQTPIAIEIRYSDYRVVDGVQVPFLIQRYVSGALQLAIAVSSAEIS